MFLDSSLLSSDVIDGDGGVDTVGDGGNEGVVNVVIDKDGARDNDSALDFRGGSACGC